MYIAKPDTVGDIIFKFHSSTPLERWQFGTTGSRDLEADDYHRMGELEPWIDENFVRSVWYNLGEQVNVKMIRDKFSG